MKNELKELMEDAAKHIVITCMIALMTGYMIGANLFYYILKMK